MSVLAAQLSENEVVGVARSYEDLVAACRARRQELGLPQIEVDEAAGLQSGYTGKLECGDKRLGAMSLPCLLGALGLELIVVRTTPHHLRRRADNSRNSGHRADPANRVQPASA